jgi:hypothetical protein
VIWKAKVVMCVSSWGGSADLSWMVACMCAGGGCYMCALAVDHVSGSPLSLPMLFSILFCLPQFVIPLFFSSKTLLTLSPLSLVPFLLPSSLFPPLPTSTAPFSHPLSSSSSSSPLQDLRYVLASSHDPRRPPASLFLKSSSGENGIENIGDNSSLSLSGKNNSVHSARSDDSR